MSHCWNRNFIGRSIETWTWSDHYHYTIYGMSRSDDNPVNRDKCVCVCDSWIISCIKNGWAEGKYILNNSPTHMHTHCQWCLLHICTILTFIFFMWATVTSLGLYKIRPLDPGEMSSGKENDQRKQTMMTCRCVNTAGGRVNTISNKLWAQGKQQWWGRNHKNDTWGDLNSCGLGSFCVSCARKHCARFF